MRHLFEWVQAILGGWDIILGKWGWVGVYGNYFGLARVSRSGWGIIVGELWWVGHYFGWMGVGGFELDWDIILGEWDWVGGGVGIILGWQE